LSICLHSSGTKVKQTTDTSKGQTHPPPTIRVHDATLNTHFEIRRDLSGDLALCFRSRRAGSEGRVEGLGRQHLRRRVDEVHWLHDLAVEFGKVEAGDAVVGVGVDAVSLHLLSSVVACVDGVGALAGLRQHLAAVNSDGCHGEGTVAADNVASVLPLHNCAGTCRVGRV